ncbi:Oxygen-independent coproporphyrinogen III oxidase [Ignavibacterium album JCM 16511]|uniref:Heme chaperone HemW n=1 Tax=Ignavibacterium album (strain DSM 19864 / JCM 16511 / NBRC 101810 / Mat9-16) TaxID=945713 RepID=I0AFU3_IGNAJ|nr:radical SAM family heme chaperone HemW [Ignavibacterium album]AFH47850.1 Oxygen-independent coproporphyrinogen III oxidase [Ignavibacterium album JCM 16511]
MKPTALYIHIPFCDHKCIYCDFYSIITSDNIESFLFALKREIDYYSKLYSSDRIITSIFFGGGTPSLMSVEYIADIIKHSKNKFNFSDNAEITLEINPGTVNKEKLIEFRNTGINRISIGIQSFDESDLKFLTRIHDKQTAINTVYNAADAGFENISIDLIFNLPDQSKEKWKLNLQQAVGLPIKHISAYSLILERGTILNKLVLDGKVKVQDEDYDAELYELTIDFLTENGFIQYEVSNFAKPGYECIHNNAYWHHQDYIGFGPSAHSFVENKRWWNFSSLKRYISEVELKQIALMNSETLTQQQLQDEYIMLALRSNGIIIEDYIKRFGSDWLDNHSKDFEVLKQQELIEIKHNKIKLTSKGYAICDEILSKIL